MSQRTTLLGLPLSAGTTIPAFLDTCRAHMAGKRAKALTITFINPHAWHQVRQHAAYLSLLHQCDIILPDGIGVAVAASQLLRVPTPRISFDFSSLAEPFLRTCAEAHWRVALVGGRPGIATRATHVLKLGIPDLNICHTGDGYRMHEDIVTTTLAAKPDVVIFAMGAPRQEEAMMALAATGFDGIVITCGGFLDQTTASTQYYPAWIDRLNLRFVYRLVREPKRLARRYLLEYFPFMRKYLAARLKLISPY